MVNVPDFNKLLKWSLSHSDSTAPARQISEEDRKWFVEAMQSQTVDVIRRMKEITHVMRMPENVLESQGITPKDIEDMLEELQEHVEAIDMANDLRTVGGLGPLLGYLKSPNANVRAKAAEVVTTVVQNNPKGQQSVMEENGLEQLMSNFSSDPDVTSRTKALGTISSLIRHNKAGCLAFRLANGYASLRDALSSDDAKFQRKALNLINYLLQENNADCNIITELGFPRVMLHLAAGDDADVREASLSSLLELARHDTSGRLSENRGRLKQVLQDRINAICTMSVQDLGAAREERQLVDSLWHTCFGEPSSLRGLLVPPDEDEPSPDVSGHFEPPLRAWSAKRDEKKETPLFLGSAPSN